MRNLAPVLLFSYKRVDTLQKVISSLLLCDGSSEIDLFIFSDAAKHDKDKDAVNLVRKFCDQIKGFKSLTLYKAETNKGLANSIISGVTKVLEEYDTAIVLEDDLIMSGNFLTYMNLALEKYKDNADIISISGYTPEIIFPDKYQYDVFFEKRSTSWGWAIWKDRWSNINWDISQYDDLSIKDKIRFYKLGCNLLPMLKNQRLGKIDSWAIRFVFNQFLNNSYSVYPIKTKITNIGFGEGATHTSNDAGYNKNLDTEPRVDFIFPDDVIENKEVSAAFLYEYSLLKKVITKLKISI